MPTVREIESLLFQFAPKELAIDWDNVGLLVGEPEKEVRRALVALDITDGVAEEAIASGCQLIVAHHPIMNSTWHKVQNVRGDTPQGRLLIRLLRSGVSCICMHTNLDIAEGGVNDALAEALELVDPGPMPGGDGICRMGTVAEPIPLERFARKVSAALHTPLRYADAGRLVRRVGVGGGSCGEYAEAAFRAGCDTFVTADLKYHGFLDAAAMGLNLIDAGHFPTEDPVCRKLIDVLSRGFPGLKIAKSTSHRDVIRYYMEGE